VLLCRAKLPEIGRNAMSIALQQSNSMFPDSKIAADSRFLEFDAGDWFVMLGGFTLVGLLVWLV